MAGIVECKNLSFTYKTRPIPSIVNINLTIEAGDFILCTGPTGCGKSTLLKAFNGLIPHEISGALRGSVLVDGVDSMQSSVAALSRTVGLMFQNPDDQIFSTTVADEVGFALENMGMEREAIRQRVSETLNWVGLSGREQGSVHALSGGERQRLALAAVLAVRPKMLALDEPISQMDPRGAMELLQVLRKLNQEFGITLIIVEHRLHEVMPLCKHVLVMENGKVVWQGTRQEAFRNPKVFLEMGLRIPQTVHICHGLGIAAESAAVEDTVRDIRKAYPHCNEATNMAVKTIPVPIENIAIEIRGLEFRYELKGRKVLDGIQLTVPRGQFVALMGNNGAGKSTLLHHICGLQQAQVGQVTVHGQKVKSLDRRVGMVMQNPDLMLFNSTVEEEITFGLHHGGPNAPDHGEWRTLLTQIGLVGMEDRFPLALSQGQRVRVAIASLLAYKPAIMLLDEPTTGQDLGHIGDIIALLQEYTASGGTVIFCTHDTEVAARYAERVVVMTAGCIVADAPPREVFSDETILHLAGLRAPAALRVCHELYGGCALCVEEVVQYVQQASLGSNAG
jgi:energy-coupling factor transport system ATP-binding protein